MTFLQFLAFNLFSYFCFNDLESNCLFRGLFANTVGYNQSWCGWCRKADF